MSRVYGIVLLLFMLLQLVNAGENFIVLESGDNKENIAAKKIHFEDSIHQDKTIQSLTEGLKFQTEIRKVDHSYLLRIGPFESNDLLALVYFKAKKYFPKAFILEKKEFVLKPEPVIQTIEKKIYVDKKIVVEKEDDILWIAMFSLACVGIFFMFISSEQIKRIKQEHEKIKIKHKKLEQKQHEALSSMGENIQIITKETIDHTYQLAEKVKATPFYDDVAKVMNNENELLDVTGDLLRFLRLKSKKVVIQHEVFNFNHVLNEVAGLLNTKYQQSDIELVFDINKDVPKYMLSDPVNLVQILINLLEYFIQNSQNKEVKIEVTTAEEKKEGLHLRFQINADIHIEDKETLFNSYYDEETRRYEGLGLFIAKELIYLMDGELKVIDRNYSGTLLIFLLPIEEKNKEKRKYRLPNKSLVGKKILIVDRSYSAALATEKLFIYFKANIDVLSAKEFMEKMPDFSRYEIVALSITLFNFKVFEALEKVKEEQDLKIISLENLFTSQEIPIGKPIDIRLKKPLTQEYVFDTLVELYAVKGGGEKKAEFNDRTTLRVYKEAFKDTPNITLESFHALGDAHNLIVEDDIVNQKTFLEILGKSRIKVSFASNGQEAIDFLHDTQEHIDIVFMNINLPVMDGYTATKIIRKDPFFDQTAIVFLTALTSEHEIEKMFESGMNGYLSKPVKMEQLYTALKVFLNTTDPLLSQESESEALPVVYEGLNIQEGIENVNGNVVFYKQVLQEFLDAYAGSDVIFGNLVKEQRYGQIKVLCLDMKGLMGTIGAKEMHTIINEIHQHIIYKKPELLHSYVEKYRVTLSTLKQSIKLYLSR